MNDTQMLSEQKKPLILIVDDVPKNLQVLGNILQKKVCDIAMATSGMQALKIIADVLPDLILLDIMMPGMDGLDVCKQLKDSPETKDIPVIFITAKTETEDIVKGFKFGAVDYVTKPFNASELLARVHTHLELKKARETQQELISKLQKALADVKLLSGLLPICANCKMIRDDKGNWNRIEAYIQKHSDAQFSHGICPDCAKKLYPDFIDS
jgi:sigma-B regulation protein RsbU (phosphoserine phosphatase)